MKVKDVIKELLEYNMDAELSVTAHCREFKFSIAYGGSEGVEKHNTKSVNFYVDELCTNEQTNSFAE